MDRLEKAGMITIRRIGNGHICCKTKFTNCGDFIKIPNSLLYSNKLSIREKAFVCCIWNHMENGVLNKSINSLHSDIFKSLNKGRVWINTQFNLMLEKNIFKKIESRSIIVDLNTVLDISNEVIDDVTERLSRSDTEVSILVGENKSLKKENRVLKKENSCLKDENTEIRSLLPKENSESSIKWILPVIEAINLGAEILDISSFHLSNNKIQVIANKVTEFAEQRGVVRKECLDLVIESIYWKVMQCIENQDQRKFYNPAYFSRTKVNNISTNIYHYEKNRLNNPYSEKPSVEKLKSRISSIGGTTIKSEKTSGSSSSYERYNDYLKRTKNKNKDREIL